MARERANSSGRTPVCTVKTHFDEVPTAQRFGSLRVGQMPVDSPQVALDRSLNELLSSPGNRSGHG